MPEHLASSFIISDHSISNLENNLQFGETGSVTVIADLLEFIDEHGHKSAADGIGLTAVEVGTSYMIAEVDDERDAGCLLTRRAPARCIRPSTNVIASALTCFSLPPRT
jgi:peptide deformylase